MSKVHSKRWLGAGFACAGALALLYACTLLAWQYATRITTGTWVALPVDIVFTAQTGKTAPIASFLPDLPAAWIGQHPGLAWMLEKVHIGLPFALAGAALLLIGVLMVLRQSELLRMEERVAADRLRRVRLGQYGDLERREPYIGPSIPDIPERHRKAA